MQILAGKLESELNQCKDQSEACRKILGYNDGDLLDNVTRFHAYATHEIKLLRAGGERVAAYARKLQELLPQETVMKLGTEAVASGLNDQAHPTAAGGTGGAQKGLCNMSERLNVESAAAVEGAAPCSAADVAKELSRIRAAVNPSRRGILICGQTMGQMLQLGWHKDQLDALEILFWSVRDADGRVKLPNDQAEARREKTK